MNKTKSKNMSFSRFIRQGGLQNVAIGLLSTCCALSAWANDEVMSEVLEAGGEAFQESRQLQGRVTAISESSLDTLAQYKLLLKELDGISRHNEQLEATLELQNLTIEELRRSIDGVGRLTRDLSPLLVRMLDSLEGMIKLDLPFETDARLARIEGVRSNLKNSSISSSQKVRQVLEAFDIELNYGRTISSYNDTVSYDGSQPREVEVLRWGRIGLFFLTKDGRRVGRYKRSTQTWETLSNEHRISIRSGLQMANDLATLDLVALPIDAPIDVVVAQ